MKIEANTVFKSIKEDAKSHHYFPLPGGFDSWPLPKNGAAGKWVGPVDLSKKDLKAHSWGIHLARGNSMIYWLGERNFIAEFKGASDQTKDALAVEYARLKQEIYLPRASLQKLAVAFCEKLVDLPQILEFDWTISRTMETSFHASRDYLSTKKSHPGYDAVRKRAEALARLCAVNSDMRLADSRNSFQYVHGCLSVAHASRALSLLPRLASAKNNAAAISIFKQIAFDCRTAISIAIEENQYRADINEKPYRPLHPQLAVWVKDADMQPHHTALVSVGEWQNRELIKKLRPARHKSIPQK